MSTAARESKSDLGLSFHHVKDSTMMAEFQTDEEYCDVCSNFARPWLPGISAKFATIILFSLISAIP